MRRLLALVLAGALLLAAVGCSKQTENKPGDTKPAEPKIAQVARVNLGTDLETLDPGVTTGVPEMTAEIALFEGVMRLDKDGKAVPGTAAKMPDVSADGLTWTITLRDGLKWSNGEPLTAQDYVYSWTRALDPNIASEYAYQLYYIKGGEALNTIPMTVKGSKGPDGKEVARPAKDIAADVEKAKAALGLKAVDAKTIQITLEAPVPYYASLLAFQTYYPVYKKAVEANPDSWFRNQVSMIGNGPFKFVSWTPKDKIIVEKNPNYYDPSVVKLDKIEYYLVDQESTATTMYESGQLDAIESGVSNTELDRLKKERPNELKIDPDLGTYYYRFNVTKKPFDNPMVRKALTLAIDRNAIVTNITKGGQIPATAFVPGGLADATGDFRKNGGEFYKDNDVATAKKLLADAGYPDGKGFPKTEILYNTSEGHKKIAEAIQEMWKKNLGIDVTLTNTEWQVYLDRESKLDYQVARAGWLGDYSDPMTFMDMWVKDGGNNQTGWTNANYDKLIQTAKTSGDQKVRMQAMHDAEKILMDEMPILPIYYYVRIKLVSPHLQGWYHPLTAGFNLREAFMK